METTRQTLGLRRTEEAKPAPKAKAWKVTLTGPTKGPKPITIIVEAESAKEAVNNIKRIWHTGRPTVEPA